MSLANTLDAIKDHKCPNGCGDLERGPHISRCPECGYYTNCTPEHLSQVVRRELASIDVKAAGEGG